MNSYLKRSLLASVSAAVLATTALSSANAFDRVSWTWDATLDETITKTVNVNIELAPTGMVMLEDLQVNIGDVTAESIVSGIQNLQPSDGGTVDLGTQDIQFHYGLGGVSLDDDFKSPSVVIGTVDENDDVANGVNGTVTATIDLGEVDVPATDSHDALTELPSIVSQATAVANNTSIVSDNSIQLHEGQFSFGVEGEGEGGSPFVRQVQTENSNLTAAGVLGVLAIQGELVKANISAESKVTDILNASVDSSATAVANNMTVSLNPSTPDDALLIGDVVQFAFADVSASSTVRDVTLTNYTNLGSLDRSIVGSVATAVGNNKSITVAVPVIVN
jgi:hypothetical protein